MKSNKSIFLYFILVTILSNPIHAQFNFTTEKLITSTSIKNQEQTGSSWSFATASFLEAEIIRSGLEPIDISEMFAVRNIYKKKARNYLLRQGNTSFGQGSLSHDLINSIREHGIMPESSYTGKQIGAYTHNHTELENGLKGYLDGILKNQPFSTKWKPTVDFILDSYLGSVKTEFEHNNQTFTPKSFAAHLQIKQEDYISATSFSHHDFYTKFILEIPDNFSNGSYYNLPLNEFIEVVDYSILNGYSIVWDGDVSEKGFSSKHGLAVLPLKDSDNLFKNPSTEISVTQDSRQAGFESLATTDDHLMHIIGIALDQNGEKYYILKNSWGETGKYNGYIYMSKAFFMAKTISITMNKKALSMKTSKRLLASVE